jgi:mevalonate kinase
MLKTKSLENLTREKLLQLKIYSLKWSFFHGKVLSLDPLNSYLSIPILINSKTILKQLAFQILDGKALSFLLDSGIVGETAPMVTIFMENLKDKAFRTMLKNSL